MQVCALCSHVVLARHADMRCRCSEKPARMGAHNIRAVSPCKCVLCALMLCWRVMLTCGAGVSRGPRACEFAAPEYHHHLLHLPGGFVVSFTSEHDVAARSFRIFLMQRKSLLCAATSMH
eukprot:1144851-Pelagomonas_calceolata.AAC.4